MLKDLDVSSVSPYAEGVPFGPGGTYEYVQARAHFAVDPLHAANTRIVDLERAPRNSAGEAEFSADVRMLRPTTTGPERVVMAIANRGIVTLPLSTEVRFRLPPTEPPAPGDGFLLRHGWTVVWCGWQWDILPGTGLVGLDAPVADVPPGWVRLEWRPDVRQDVHALNGASAPFRLASLPTADRTDPDATLSCRESPDGPARVLPRSSWSFTDDTHVSLAGGFEPFHWYQLIYRTKDCPVVGTGLLAARDLAGHLRDNGAETVVAVGESQAGRFLRQMLWDGQNIDDRGRAAFDGVLCINAGSRRGEFNHRYGQPSLTHPVGFGHLPPYDTDAVLATQRGLGATPKVVLVNSSCEYWRGDAGLVHADPVSGGDLAEVDGCRTYLVVGPDHFGPLPGKDRMPVANPVHDLDATRIVRALFVALVGWLRDDEPMPASAVPRWDAGTASWRPDVLARFDHVVRPEPSLLETVRVPDLGPDAEAGVGRWPAVVGAAQSAVVSNVDDDGNELAGIRHPAVGAPLGAYTGWNVRRSVAGLPDVVYEFVGGRVPFPAGRPTIEERYAGRYAYRETVRRAAEKLVASRFLLGDDLDGIIAETMAQWDIIVGPAEP